MKNIFVLILLLILTSCYEPSQYESSAASKNNTASSNFGTVYEVNGGKQICNPSVSLDTVNFPAAMLWLNFSGTLNVTSAPKGYSTSGAGEHDRLTVSDTAGKVLWYVMKDAVPGVECEFQDPEWSTSADYIVALGGFKAKGSPSCDDDKDYGIVAIRPSDKASFFLIDSGMEEIANPHLWVGGLQASVDSTDSLQLFFGTDEVKLVYVTAAGKIAFIDYATSAKANTLVLPDSTKGNLLDSPLISPDGNWVVYDVLDGSYSWKSYIQELSTTAEPVEISKTSDMISNPVFPHWWKFGNRLFVVWTEFASSLSYLNKSDLTNSSTWDYSVGRTAMREVELTAGAPKDVALEWTSDVREIAPVPFIGGRSPDGHFLATGTNNGYLLNLP